MTTTEIATLATRLVLVAVSLLAAVDYLRNRGRARLNSALMLGSLGFAVILAFFPEGIRTWRPLAVISAVVVISQPVLLINLIRVFKPVSRRVLMIAVLTMVVSWILSIVFPSPAPLVATLFIIAYFLVFESYATVVFLMSVPSTRGATRWRLIFVSAGSAALAVVLLLAGAATAVPALKEPLTLTTAVIPVLIGVFYYLGFVPPVWLRNLLRALELNRFLRAVAGASPGDRSEVMARQLADTAIRATGGAASWVVLWDDKRGVIELVAETYRMGDRTSLESVSPELLQILQNKERQYQLSTSTGGESGARGEGHALLAVPIPRVEGAWGCIAVSYPVEPIFPDDDAELLGVLAEQYSIAVDGDVLIRQYADLAESLRRTATELEAFSYSVSHDLRAPLRAIDGFTKILEEDYGSTLPDEGRRQMGVIRANVRRMGELIDDLLSFSRLSRQGMQSKRVDNGQLVRSLIEELKGDYARRQIQFEVAELPATLGDPDLIRQVWANLIGNAIKYTKDVAVAKVVIGSETKESTVTFVVRDNGVGFDMKYADKLFGVFQRLHRQEDYEGTGVGLAIVQRIVHRHGGRVWAEAESGKGASFFFSVEGINS